MFSYQKYQESGIPALLKSVVVAGLLFLIGSCDSSESQNRFTITADIEGLEAQTAILRYNRWEGEPVTLDSSSVDNGSFTFEGMLDSPRELTVWTKPDDVFFKFYADNGKINVTGNVEDAQMGWRKR